MDSDMKDESKDAVYQMPNQYYYNGHYFNSHFFPEKNLDNLRKLELSVDDIVVNSYPRTGSTLIGHIASLILAKDGDIVATSNSHIHARLHYLERVGHLEGHDTLEDFKRLEKPRMIRSHLSYQNIASWVDKYKAKIIVSTRNPKDGLVSVFDFYKGVGALGHFSGSWDDFFKMYQTGEIWYGDSLDWIQGWWLQLPKPNVHFVYYEKVVRNKEEEVKRLAEFLGKDLSAEQLSTIVDQTSFESMKSNEGVNFKHESFTNDFQFIRKGKIGAWKNYFTVAQNEWFDRHMAGKLEGLAIDWQFE